MSEELLTILKLCLLALLYLFFLRVLWAVWTELREPKPVRAPLEPPAAGRGRARTKSGGKGTRIQARAARLVVVEPPEQAGIGYPLADELTLGRAAGCQITLDDTFVSQIHARMFTREGEYLVEDLGSTNGTYLNRQKVAAPMLMQYGDRLQIGSTVLELSR